MIIGYLVTLKKKSNGAKIPILCAKCIAKERGGKTTGNVALVRDTLCESHCSFCGAEMVPARSFYAKA